MTALRVDPLILFQTATVGKAALTNDGIDAVITAVNEHADELDSGNVSAGLPWITPEQFGAVGDGVTSDLAAFKAMDSAVSAAGGMFEVRFGAKTYILPQDGAQAYCWKINSSNVTFRGVYGKTFLKAPPGMPGSSVPLIRCDKLTGMTFDGVGFDGNWGNGQTTVAEASSRTALPTATINVVDTSDFPSSGTTWVMSTDGISLQTAQLITYTGKTATSFTGCTGGTGTIMRGYGVGMINDNTGGNHSSQVDAKNYLLFLQGCSSVVVNHCRFRQGYGDHVWIGNSSTTLTIGCSNIRVTNCDLSVGARHGFTIGLADDVIIKGCRVTGIFASPIFEQTNTFQARNLIVDGNYLGDFFDSSRGGNTTGNLCLAGDNTVSGGVLVGGGFRNWKIVNNVLMGGCALGTLWDFVFENNHSIMNWGTAGSANLKVQTGGGGVRIDNNWFYSRIDEVNKGLDGLGDTGCVVITNNAGASPASLQIRNNQIHPRFGRHGIVLTAAGGAASTSTGTATATGLLSVTDGTAPWTTNSEAGKIVRIGTALASIASNTTTVLTLDKVDTSQTSAWVSFYGDYQPTPSTGTYQIFRPIGVVEVSGNEIDGRDDGNGGGGVGIWLTQAAALLGSRVRIHHNNFIDVTPVGIYVQWNATSTMPHVEIFDNYANDDQPTRTTMATVAYSTVPNVTKWIQRSNVNNGGVLFPVANQMALVGTASTNNLAHTAHNCIDGQGPIYLTNIVGLSGLSTNTPYWVFANGANNIKLATSQANALAHTVVPLTTDGTCTGFIQGPTFGTWLEHDGAVQSWAGVGTPEAAITAQVGSIYRRLDGSNGIAGAGGSQYEKISGQSNTGWRLSHRGIETKTTGALTPSVQVSLITTSGTVAYTLADGDATVDGMVKKFLVTAATGTPAGTLTPTHLADGTTHTITWSAVCSFELLWDHTNTTWRVVGTPRNATVN